MIKESLVWFLKSKKVYIISQLLLGGIFIYASLGKIIHVDDFMTVVRNYRILPPLLVKITAYVLPWLEFILGILLVLNIYARVSAGVLTLLLLVFIGAILSTLVRGINIDCGCFWQQINKGTVSSSSPDSVFLILRDILFLIPGIIIFFFKGEAK